MNPPKLTLVLALSFAFNKRMLVKETQQDLKCLSVPGSLLLWEQALASLMDDKHVAHFPPLLQLTSIQPPEAELPR